MDISTPRRTARALSARRTGKRLITASCLALAALCTSLTPARAVTIDWVTVGDPGNAADTSPSGYGAVASDYRIMKYEWTNSLYVKFLNAIDPQGTNPNSVYNTSMGSDARAGITNTGTTDGSRYAFKTNMGDKPVNYVSWFDAARVSNWLHNGGLNYGTTNSSGTAPQNTGAYTLGTATLGTAPAVNLGAQFYVPTEDQWYKAAYYKGSGTNAVYWDYATQSDTAPTAVNATTVGTGTSGGVSPVTTGNFANYNSAASWNSRTGNVTTVGTNGGASAYAAFDMSGNIFEWNDLTGAAGSYRGLRGGCWLNDAFGLSSSGRLTFGPSDEGNFIGFRLASPVPVPEPSTWVMGLAGIACAGWGAFRRRNRSPRCRSITAAVSSIALAVLFLTPARAVTIDWVTVGDPGNAADTTGDPNPAGAVADSFQIMKYEFTNQQYTAFLNSVAATDTYSLYNGNMGSNAHGGITQSGASGSYTYAVRSNMGDKPVNYVSWFDAARVSNWLMNGATGTSSTETGAYTLVRGQTSGDAPARNSGATFSIPTGDQWYKAAYYKGSGTNAGYWDYATQSDTAPAAVSATTSGTGTSGGVSPVTSGNVANFAQLASWNGQTTGNVTTVGTNGGASAYGAFDMSGNVYEWNDLTGTAGSSRGLRGGSWGSPGAFVLSSSFKFTIDPSLEVSDGGFRLASPVPVPEPSTWVMGLAGIACAGWGAYRSRKRA
jgi:formylglycine-generating enzyme required for sulfatase activity